jgi:cation transport ATPase
MLQRIQTVWLLLAAVSGILTLNFSFYSGVQAGNNAFHILNAKENNIILILTVATSVAAFISIFLFKNRKLQLRITITCILASILIVVLYFLQIKNYSTGAYTLWSIFAFAIPVFLILAARGIYKDEKLVKSLDRLR